MRSISKRPQSISRSHLTVIFAYLATAIILHSAPAGDLSTGRHESAKVLRWKFERGQKLNVLRVRSSKSVTTSSAPVTIERSTKSSDNYVFLIEGVDKNGAARVALSMGRTTMSMTGPDGKINFDSAAEDPKEGPIDEMSKGMREILQAMRIHFTMSPRGNILEPKFDEESINLIQSSPGAAGLKRFTSPQAITDMLKNLFPPFPESAVNVNDTWKDSLLMRRSQGDQTMERVFTYKGTTIVDGNQVEQIDNEGKIDFGGFIKAASKGGIKTVITSQDNHGTQFFDSQSGIPISIEVSENVQIDGTASGGSLRQVESTTTKITVSRLK